MCLCRTVAAAPLAFLTLLAACDDAEASSEAESLVTETLAEPEEATPEPAPAEPEAAPELDVEGEPRYGAVPLAPGFSPDPREHRGEARGVLAASALGEDCEGFLTEAPLHVIAARGPFARMHLMAVGEVPVGLALRTAEGQVRCTPVPESDDEPATLVTHLGTGAHGVWVITAEEDDRVRYTLGLSEVELDRDSLAAP